MLSFTQRLPNHGSHRLTPSFFQSVTPKLS
ncbi:Uncharacterised protein [Vibrio cholerae]|nr:Uncharacterised protein [Vibrio cholerae]